MSDSELDRNCFTIFWRQAWQEHAGWEDIEPWEREAWRMVVGYIKTESEVE